MPFLYHEGIEPLFVLCFGSLLGAVLAPTKATDGLARRFLPLPFGIASVVSPIFAPGVWPFLRTCVAFALAGSFLRLVEIVRRPETFDLRQRVINVVFPFLDARHLGNGTAGVRMKPIAIATLELAIAVGLFLWVGDFPQVNPYSGAVDIERTLIGGTSAYFFVDATGRGLHGVIESFGVAIPKPHDHPILSKSLAEFWGKRWNRAVGKWLHDNAFRPAAVRFGIAAGVMAAFGMSALLHFVPILLVASLKAAIWMAAFFLVHGILVLVEAKLRIAGRALTVLTFLVTAPMFVEPMLEALGR